MNDECNGSLAIACSIARAQKIPGMRPGRQRD